MNLQSDERNDWALACWVSGRRLTSSFFANVSSLEKGMWKVADRLLFEYRPVGT
jgi:hypothetical protein